MADDSIKRAAAKVCDLIFSKREKDPEAYDTTATVRRVEGGTAYVHIPGGVDETPVDLTIDAKAGDTVQVRVSGGRAWLVGNRTAPPTDDTTARVAQSKAVIAEGKAEEAEQTANAVSGIANSALSQAQEAKQIADDTEQHFWFTETGTDTGAHITEVPQEAWSDPSDPNYQSGGNLLARSNGIAVRDGLTELASMASTGMTFKGLDGEGNLIDYFYVAPDATLLRSRKAIVNGQVLLYFITPQHDSEGFHIYLDRAAQLSQGLEGVKIGKDECFFKGTYDDNQQHYQGNAVRVSADDGDGIEVGYYDQSGNYTENVRIEADNGDITTTGNIWADGNIEADGDMNCNGNMSTGGTVTAEGDIESLNGGIIATGADIGALTAGTVTTTGDASIGGDITVGGHATPIGYNGTTTNTSGTRGNSTSYAGIGLQVSLPKGVWMLTGTITFASNTTGRRAVRLTNAGTAIACSEVVSPPANGAATALHTSAVVENTTSSSKTYAMQCYQNSGSTQNVTGELRYVRIA